MDSSSKTSPWISGYLLLILSLSVLFVSISFNVLLFKTNRTLSFQRAQQLDQWQKIQPQFLDMKNKLHGFAHSLAEYSVQRPELGAIIQNHGFSIQHVNVAAPPPPPIAAPIPPENNIKN